MATTTYGSPYVQSSDLVSGWPTSSLAVADRIDDVAMKGNGINAQTGTTYTTLLTDAGKTITTSNAAAVTVTIPTNASVAYEIGSVIQFLNIGVGALTIAASGGVTINNNLGTTAQYGAYSILKTATDTWYATPFSSGSAKATVSATTGSPTTTTVSGKTLYQFTGSGSITMTAGTFDTLMIGAGAGGGAAYGGGGGGGQVLYLTGQLAAAGTYTVTVGAGSAGSSGTYASGGKSVLGSLISVGGGHGGTNAANRTTGGDGSSGGGGAVSAIGGLGLTYDGAAGRTDGATYSSGGGGAGAGAIGIYPATGGTAPSGGAGTANSITGASVTYGGGGGGGSQAGTPGAGGAGGGGAGTSTNGATATAGTANTGGGGGGGGYNGTGGAGGSGCVFILIG